LSLWTALLPVIRRSGGLGQSARSSSCQHIDPSLSALLGACSSLQDLSPGGRRGTRQFHPAPCPSVLWRQCSTDFVPLPPSPPPSPSRPPQPIVARILQSQSCGDGSSRPTFVKVAPWAT